MSAPCTRRRFTVWPVTFLVRVFGDDAKFGADTEVESPSSSSFSRCVALEQALRALPLARCESCRKTADMFCLWNQWQRMLAEAATGFYRAYLRIRGGSEKSSWR